MRKKNKTLYFGERIIELEHSIFGNFRNRNDINVNNRGCGKKEITPAGPKFRDTHRPNTFS